jgi:drug/metabolite transporter (DMT)-like permease
MPRATPPPMGPASRARGDSQIPVANATRGALFMLGSAFAFSIMAVLVKLVGERIPSQEILLARAIVSLGLSLGLLRHAGVSFWGVRRKLLLLRGTFGFLGLTCVFYSLTHLPLAEATVIQYLHPTFTAVLAAIFLGEAIRRSLLLAGLVSLAGVALVAKPALLFGASASPLPPVALAAAVAGAFFSGCAYVTVRKLSASEHPLVIVFYFPLVSIPASLPWVLNDFVMPTGIEWIWLLGVGCTTQLGQVWLTRGIELQTAARATALSYLQVVFATVAGVALFGEIPDSWTLAGAVLVVFGTLAVSRVRE